ETPLCVGHIVFQKGAFKPFARTLAFGFEALPQETVDTCSLIIPDSSAAAWALLRTVTCISGRIIWVFFAGGFGDFVSDPINLKRSHHVLEFPLAHPFRRSGEAMLDLSKTCLEIQIPPGSANGTMRAAMLTPSPITSSARRTTSPA